MKLPEDSFILLSYVNTKLRDDYSSLEDFCEDNDCSPQYITQRMNEIGYFYDEDGNKFLRE
jgi:hypothetical protein